jgi:hypothetical protein
MDADVTRLRRCLPWLSMSLASVAMIQLILAATYFPALPAGTTTWLLLALTVWNCIAVPWLSIVTHPSSGAESPGELDEARYCCSTVFVGPTPPRICCMAVIWNITNLLQGGGLLWISFRAGEWQLVRDPAVVGAFLFFYFTCVLASLIASCMILWLVFAGFLWCWRQHCWCLPVTSTETVADRSLRQARAALLEPV